MPFGLTNAPATFQRALDILLSGVKWQYCLVYLDDVIIFSNDEETHLQHVDTILTLLQNAGITLKFSKPEFFRSSVDYLGHKITQGRLEVNMKRKNALRKAKYPCTQTQIRSYIGMCDVYRRFLKDFAKIASPLTQLLKRGCTSDIPHPGQEEMRSLETLKNAPLNPPILQIPNPERPYTVDVDACDYQLGCALLQEQEDGKLLPVGYYSRTLIGAEKNYSTTEKECRAVVWEVLLLRPYLEGAHFRIRSDHNALRWLLSLKKVEGRLARWRLRLAEFDLEIMYKPGTQNAVADAMSRIETRALDETDLEDHIPCFTCAFEEAEEPDMELLPPCYTGNDICLAVEPSSSPRAYQFF